MGVELSFFLRPTCAVRAGGKWEGQFLGSYILPCLFFWMETQALVLYISTLSFLLTFLYFDFLLFHWVFIWQGLKELPCLPLTGVSSLPLICVLGVYLLLSFPVLLTCSFLSFIFTLHILLVSSLLFPPPKSACQCRRHKRCGFSPWVGKILWRREWQSTQYSWLKKPLDRAAWKAAIVLQRTELDWSNLVYSSMQQLM